MKLFVIFVQLCRALFQLKVVKNYVDNHKQKVTSKILMHIYTFSPLHVDGILLTNFI